MRFSLATIIAVVPLLVSATPFAQSPPVTIPIFKRTNLHHQDGSVNIDALKASASASIAKILRGFDAYQRNTGERHPSQPANYKRAVGEDALTDYEEQLWYGNISVGTPAVSFTVDFDTGSSDLFLPASSCDSSCNGHDRYNPSSSSTSKDLRKGFFIGYADGSVVSGELYTDTVQIEGLTATKQTIGVATQYSAGFQSANFPADGLMGMAFQSLSVYPARPVFQTLVSEGRTSSPVFALKLAERGSKLSVGGLDSSIYSGTPDYTSIIQQGFWQIPFSSITVNGTSVFQNSTSSAVFDSGTTFIIGSPSGVEAIYKKIPGSQPSAFGTGFYDIPCSTNLPTVAFTIGDKHFPISASSLNLGPDPNNPSNCIGSIISIADTPFGNLYWIFGDPFIRNYYTIFDYGNLRVGLATLK